MHSKSRTIGPFGSVFTLVFGLLVSGAVVVATGSLVNKFVVVVGELGCVCTGLVVVF